VLTSVSVLAVCCRWINSDYFYIDFNQVAFIIKRIAVSEHAVDLAVLKHVVRFHAAY
jgi:hypothetical protein